jgi:hypothetical protein
MSKRVPELGQAGAQVVGPTTEVDVHREHPSEKVRAANAPPPV